jgi:glycerol kinase
VIRIDGGMSRNAAFARLLADATGKRVEVSPETESTTLGAAFLAGSATGLWSTLDEAVSTWKPATIVTPANDPATRSESRRNWLDSVQKARGWIPDLSALDF